MASRVILSRLAVLAVLGAVTVTGCGRTDGTGAASKVTPSGLSGTVTDERGVDQMDGELAGTHWQATRIGGDPVAAGTVVTAVFGVDASLSGSGGCNSYSTTVTVDGDGLRIGEIAGTLMACEPAVMAQESTYYRALEHARSFTRDTDTLALTGEDGRPLVAFAAQAQELAGRWSVTGYNNGHSAVISVLTGTSPTVEFTEGRLSGSGGCNQLTGTYETDGTGVTVGPVAATRMACPEPDGMMEQEKALIAALESAAEFTVEGDQLVLRTADGAIALSLTRV